QHGNDPSFVFPMTWYTSVVPDQSLVYEQAGRHLIDYFRTVATVFDPEGVDDPLTKGIYQGFHDWNTSVTYDQIDQETDVALFGDPDTVIEKLKRAQEAGVEKVHCFMNFGTRPHDDVVASMRLFAREVMPA